MKKDFLKGNVLILSIASLFNDIASDMIYPLLPLFIATVGGTPKVLGLIEGIGETVASLLKLFSGYVSDLIKRKKILTFTGYFFSSAFRPLYVLANSWGLIFIIRLFDRVGKGIRTAPRDALIADSVSEKDRAKAFSFHRALDNLGALIGPLIAMLALAIFNNNIKIVFLLSIIPSLFVIVALFFIKEERSNISNIKIKPSEILTLKGFPKKIRFFFLSVFIFTLGNSSDAFIIYRLKIAGVDTVYIPLLWGVFNLVKSLGNYPAGMIADRTNKKKVIIFGWLLYAIIYLLLGFFTSKAAIVTVFLFYGLYYSLTEGVERAYIADLISPDLRGSAFGLYNFAIGISAFPASFIFGYIWERYSYTAAFLTGSLISLFALMTFLLSQNVLSQKKSKGLES